MRNLSKYTPLRARKNTDSVRTLVNEALAMLLKGSNTTISIAHRLSTIKRSDTIICLSNDGRVAEMGSYRELSSRPDGAFTKLMEWQMSGGEPTPGGNKDVPISGGGRGLPTESEEIEHMLQTEGPEHEEGTEAEETIQGSKVSEHVTAVAEEKK
jgi:putative ABC transport system ATP-binding protein